MRCEGVLIIWVCFHDAAVNIENFQMKIFVILFFFNKSQIVGTSLIESLSSTHNVCLSRNTIKRHDVLIETSYFSQP